MAKLTFNVDLCKCCGLCILACPKKLLSLDEKKLNAKGHRPAQIVNQDECVGCARCAIMCPDCVITVER